ncbi:MAG: hypothetical protein LAP38_08750 [Acidobacteriia bacterium]|nr:hypothetical protein [Terriglobia bacterium]
MSQTYRGTIRNVDAKSLDLEAEDTRILTIQITDTTTKPDQLKAGDGVDVVATQDKDGLYQAVSIKSNPKFTRVIKAPDQPQAQAEPEPVEERTGPPPTILVRPDQRYDPGDAPPKLKRGIPERVAKERKEEEAAPPQRQEVAVAAETVAPRAPAPANNSRMAFVEKAREVAASFLEGLPNYVCQEITTRYMSETREPSWNVVDVVAAEVVYEDGKESYRNLTINGKPSKKSPEDSGAWSTGEFGTILAEVFSPGSAAAFKYAQDDSIAHRSASVYDFAVERLRSSWKIRVPGQYIMPAYKGSVWIDKESAHTLRIEMQAREVPEEFPRATVETAVDYDYITLGTPQKFLLPVRAEVLSCARGSNECERNVIEFRNYHKFSGESIIKFNQ